MFEFAVLAWYRLLAVLGLSSRTQLYLHDEPTQFVSLVDDERGRKKKTTTLRQVVERCSALTGHFTPTAWLSSGHLATIFASTANFSYDQIHYRRTTLGLPDGGQIAIDITEEHGQDDDPKRPILVVNHGLTGGSHESYVISVLSKVVKPASEGGLDWRGVVVNYRGCAGSKITTNQLYSGAWTDDLRCALTYLSHKYPDAPVYGIGFSLGANVLAKYLGEEGEATPMKAGIALACPWDFWAGHLVLTSSWLRLVYSRAMASNLRRLLLRHRHVFEKDERLDWDAATSNPNQTLYEFDSVVTRVLAGYPSTENYYRTASAHNYAGNIAVPLLSVNSLDDPIVGGTTVPTQIAKTNPNLVFALTKHGGHLGWFEGMFRPRRWIVKPVLEFLREVHAADPAARMHLPTEPAVDKQRAPRVGDEMVRRHGNDRIGFKVVDIDGVELATAGVMKDQPDDLIRGL